MAKYIVDLPDAYTSKSALLGDILSIPIILEGGKRYGIPTGIKLESCTEPDEDEIRQKVEDEVWELAKKIGSFKGLTRDELNECFGYITIQDVMTKYDTYQEAKSKYDAWEQEKEEVHVGDEVKIANTIGVVTRVPEYDEQRVHYIAESGTVYCNNAYADIVKTGRHFDEVENLLKKMEED